MDGCSQILFSISIWFDREIGKKAKEDSGNEGHGHVSSRFISDGTGPPGISDLECGEPLERGNALRCQLQHVPRYNEASPLSN